MGLAFAAACFLLSRHERISLRLPVKPIAAALALLAGAGYAKLTGAHLPILRSLAMAWLVTIGVIIGRRAISLRGLALAAMLIMLATPEAIIGVSFQMSFSAVLGLIACYAAVQHNMSRLHESHSRVATHVVALAYTSLLAGGASMPFAAYQFQQIQPYWIPTNLIAVPLTAFWIMPLGLDALALMPFGLSSLALVPMGWGISVILWLTSRITAWPEAMLRIPPMPGPAILLIAAGLILGFRAFAAANVARLPQNNAQNTSGGAVAFGERAVLPRETITIAAGYLDTQETGFALDIIAISRSIPFTMQDLRASDEITLGTFTVKPELSATRYNFPNLCTQNRTDAREGLTTAYLPGGPVQLVLRLGATQSNYNDTIFSAGTNQVLAGLVDTANGLWTFSALAGLAQRQPRNGTALTAPVLEAGFDWMPGDLDRLRLTISREIDDPDEVSATPYTLSQAKLTLAHEYLNNIILKFATQVPDASYIQSPLRETLYSSDANISWQFGARLALNGDYTFNDRQANYLRAANEHIITLGVTWTP
jgi:ComEC/Rec2-related protein